MTLKRYTIEGPFKGIISDLPSATDRQAFDDALNFFFRKGQAHGRPRFNTGFASPPDGALIRNMMTFQDVQNFLHTLVLTTKNAYMITNPWTYNALSYPGGITNLSGTALPYSWVNINQRLYFSNGSVKLLYSDGESSLKVAGDVPGSPRFLCENANHLIGAYWTEPAPGQANSVVLPKRIRWSDSGLPDVWTPAANNSAGLSDLLNVPDSISGLGTLGKNTYVWRTNGISIGYPTGAIPAFTFENYSNAPKGAGNSYTYSLDIYSDMAFFISRDDIYKMTPSDMTSIGSGKNGRKIFADIAAATDDQIVGFIIPQMSPAFEFLSYWISIPGPVNVTWVYNIKEDNWTKINSSKGRLTALESVTTA